MLRSLAVVSLLFLSQAATLAAQAPSSTKPATAKADYSQEGFVIEQVTRKEKFENEGTSSSSDTARVKIQSEAGVQRYGLLSFSYASATGSFAIDYVRARKPDGSVVETPAENVQDMAAQITREAPSYSDLHEKHVAVKGLSVRGHRSRRAVRDQRAGCADGEDQERYRSTRDRQRGRLSRLHVARKP
jgi:hypothetical protein